jgi:hypothetical protein
MFFTDFDPIDLDSGKAWEPWAEPLFQRYLPAARAIEPLLVVRPSEDLAPLLDRLRAAIDAVLPLGSEALGARQQTELSTLADLTYSILFASRYAGPDTVNRFWTLLLLEVDTIRHGAPELFGVQLAAQEIGVRSGAIALGRAIIEGSSSRQA